MNTSNEKVMAATEVQTLGEACIASCRKFMQELNRTRRAILAQFRGLARANEHLLDLALNEAEALAVQSGFPHLVFPTLAMEKAQAVMNWVQKQGELRLGAHLQAAA